jgi:hypothetical protein
MKRSSSSAASNLILIVVCLLLVALFLHRVLRTSPPRNRPPTRSIPLRSYGGPRYREHDHNPPERGSQLADHAAARSPRTSESCSTLGITCTSEYFADWTGPSAAACHTLTRNGYPVPDPQCTPGGVNPSVTEDSLRSAEFRTSCIRNCESSEAAKHATYKWYGLVSPRGNSGENQICELDHLVPLELGGADGLGNLWPQCGPDGVALDRRDFKMKDHVENYLAEQVRSGQMPLDSAQRGIATDWTQFLDVANQYCSSGGRC